MEIVTLAHLNCSLPLSLHTYLSIERWSTAKYIKGNAISEVSLTKHKALNISPIYFVLMTWFLKPFKWTAKFGAVEPKKKKCAAIHVFLSFLFLEWT